MNPDFSKMAADYSLHRHGFPGELSGMLSNLGISLMTRKPSTSGQAPV
jgi:hypothetical protein